MEDESIPVQKWNTPQDGQSHAAAGHEMTMGGLQLSICVLVLVLCNVGQIGSAEMEGSL